MSTPPPGGAGPLRLEYVPLGELRGWPSNPKEHNVAGIRGSVDRWGFNDPMVVDERSGQLVEGHGRLKVLLAMREAGALPPGHVQVRPDGEWAIPVVRGVAFESEAEAEAYLAAHNQLTISGGWDAARLAAILARAKERGVPAETMGFGRERLDAILDRAAARRVQVELSDVADEFWVTVRGPLPAQREVLDQLRAALSNIPGVIADVGVVER